MGENGVFGRTSRACYEPASEPHETRIREVWVRSLDGSRPPSVAQFITGSKEVEAFFRSAVARYRSQGFASTRAEVKQIERLGHSIFSVDVRWINLDKDGVDRASESWRYTLKASADEQPRIQVAVMKTDGA